MSDLPTFGAIQQMHARPVSGEHLEVLGKQASARWACGEAKTLTDAVVMTVKHAGLSPEQVKRVVEFANQDAYLKEFKKEGTVHKFVDFQGGPANPSEILKDLNDGGGGSVFDSGSSDYDYAPTEKRASINGERELDALFEKTAGEIPFADELAPLVDFREKVASAHTAINDQLGGLEIAYADLADRMYQKVKQAALDGVALGEVVQALSEVAPSTEHMKVAFQLLTPRLVREGVFSSLEEVESSFQKTAGAKIVNEEHPLLTDFSEYCETLSKLAELRKAAQEAEFCLGGVTRLIKEAGAHPQGLYGLAGDKLKRLADPAAKATSGALGKAFGENSVAAGLGGSLVGKGIRNAHHLAAAALVNEMLGGKPMQVLNSYMPWDSQDKMIRQQAGLGSLITGRY